MATVVLNLHGLMLGILQLFLRSNTAAASFRPKHTPGWDGPMHEIRLFGPNELHFDAHMLQPVSGPRSPSLGSPVSLMKENRKMPSLDSLQIPERGPPWTLSSTTSPLKSAALEDTDQSNISPSRHYRPRAYSLFPPDASTLGSEKLLPTALQSTPAMTPGDTLTSFLDTPSLNRHKDIEAASRPESLAPPTPLFAHGRRGHFRESSWVSSATVQIGLRLSNAVMSDDAVPGPLLVRRPGSPPRPPRLQTQNLRTVSPAVDRDALMKVLPPVPGALGSSPKTPSQLSQSVYSVSTSPRRSPLSPDLSPTASPGRYLHSVDDAPRPNERPTARKADWI